jgi:hypothetical protein
MINGTIQGHGARGPLKQAGSRVVACINRYRFNGQINPIFTPEWLIKL